MMEFISENQVELLGALGAIVAIGVLIARRTKNTADDKVFGFLDRILSVFRGRK